MNYTKFANFLERLATSGVSFTEWDEYLVAHYSDPLMEKARNSVVKFTLNCQFAERSLQNSRLELLSADVECCQIKAIASNFHTKPEQFRS